MAGGWQLGDSPSWLNSPRLVKGTHCYPGILFFCFFSATLRLGKVLIGASKRENMRWLQVHEDWWKWDVFFLPWPMANPLPKVLTQLDHRMWLKNLDNHNSSIHPSHPTARKHPEKFILSVGFWWGTNSCYGLHPVTFWDPSLGCLFHMQMLSWRLKSHQTSGWIEALEPNIVNYHDRKFHHETMETTY